MTEKPNPIRIVVGVDGSEASIEALRVAQYLATVLDTELVAAGYWEYPVSYTHLTLPTNREV